MTSPAQRVPVLMYHRIGAAHNDWERKYCVGPEAFAAHMDVLARAGWKAVSIDDFFTWLDGGASLPEGAFLLTFDGSRGVPDHAVRCCTGSAGRRRYSWSANHRRARRMVREAQSGRPHLSADGSRTDPRAARRGFSFHSHTRDHADLPTLDDAALQAQLAGARHDLEALLGGTGRLPLPLRALRERVLRQARHAGHTVPRSRYESGFNRPDVDRFRLRRLDVFGTDTPAMLRRKITLGSNDGRLTAALR